MRYVDLYPEDLSKPQRLYCDDCKGYLSLIYDEFDELVEDINIRIQGLPYLYCEKCDVKYLPNKSRLAAMLLFEDAKKKGLNAVYSPRNKPNERFEFCCIDFKYDSDDYYYLPGLCRSDDPGFLTPVFFNKAVLIKYDNHPEYNVKMASRTYGSIWKGHEFGIEFGINKNHKIIMWLGDIDKLPENEQYYLKSENIESDHDLGSEFYDGQIECIFTDKAQEDVFIDKRSKFSEAFFSRFDCKLYKLETEVVDIIRDMKTPVVYSEREMKNIIDVLNKIVVESIDNRSLGNLLNSYNADCKNLKGLKRLYKIFEHNFPNETNRTLLSSFFVLNDLRNYYFHFSSNEKCIEIMQSIRERLHIPLDNTSEELLYNTLLAELIRTYSMLINLMKK